MLIFRAITLFILTTLAVIVLAQVGAFAEDAQDYFQTGHKFYLDSKPDRSEVAFKKALQLDPSLSDAYYYLGSIYFKQDRYAQAIEQCQKALELNPEDLKSLIILGLSLQQQGLIDLAINTFLRARDIDRQSAAVHSALGLAYCAKGDLTQARQEYNILKEIDPELASDLIQQISESDQGQR